MNTDSAAAATADKNISDYEKFDFEHVWHPYTSLTNPLPTYEIVKAQGCCLELADGTRLVDGMSSWWACIHGYNVRELNEAVSYQIGKMSHVMFGGIRHESATGLAHRLIDITPESLQYVFFADSGSVAVEVSLKMALQYFSGRLRTKKRFLALSGGYHGDTFGAMSVTDPVGSMHSIYSDFLTKNFFVKRPACRFYDPWDPDCCTELYTVLREHHDEIAAVILEPVVQGAGGMYFYHPEFLRKVRAYCDYFNVLFIADEIATGFGRTGKLFACSWAGVEPDIMAVGKALTGGYMTLSAVLCNEKVMKGICTGSAGVLMHGPTFMGNPLATRVACASVDLLLSSDWVTRVRTIEAWLKKYLLPLSSYSWVEETRVLGSIGVVEVKTPVNMAELQKSFVKSGAWIRPFGKLIYLMLPYIITEDQVKILCSAIEKVLSEHVPDEQ